MDKYEMLKLDNQLCFALYACSREIIKSYQPHLDELGLTYTQYVTMLALWESPVISLKDLGNKLYLDSGTLTPLLKKLEAAGLIERKRDVCDERSMIIRLTEKGTALREAAAKIPEKMLCATAFSMDEAVALREQIKKLIEQLSV